MAPKIVQKIINKFKGKGYEDNKTTPQTSNQAAETPKQTAHSPPSVPGFTLVWSDDFAGPAGSAVNANNWLSYTGDVYNHELETYTVSLANAHLSGSGQVYIIPLKDGTAWTSARLHGKGSFACDPGHAMFLQASIRLGTNPPGNQKGIWPAFWALGEDFNTGIAWPQCGEWDILELTNGSNVNFGTIHYGTDPGNGHKMIHQTDGTTFAPGVYHTWALKVDRTTQEETLTWYLDGSQFFQVTEAQVNDPVQWDALAHKPFFPLLNVAVGGDFPGPPNDQTLGGLESGMQVSYVAFYKSN